MVKHQNPEKFNAFGKIPVPQPVRCRDLKKSFLYRASCNSVELRLRVEPDVAWLTIKRPDAEREYHDIAQGEVAGVVEQFLAIGEDPEKFNAFLSRVA